MFKLLNDQLVRGECLLRVEPRCSTAVWQTAAIGADLPLLERSTNEEDCPTRRLRRRTGLAQLGGSGSSVVEKYHHENVALRATIKMFLRAISSLGFGSNGSEHPWEGGNYGSSATVSSPAATKRAVGRIAEALSAY